MNRGIDKLGRIVIPKEIRKKLNITKDTNLNIEVENDKIVLIKENDIDYKQVLNEIRKCCENNSIEVNTREYGNLVVTNIDDILQIIDKVLGGNDEDKVN